MYVTSTLSARSLAGLSRRPPCAGRSSLLRIAASVAARSAIRSSQIITRSENFVSGVYVRRTRRSYFRRWRWRQKICPSQLPSSTTSSCPSSYSTRRFPLLLEPKTETPRRSTRKLWSSLLQLFPDSLFRRIWTAVCYAWHSEALGFGAGSIRSDRAYTDVHAEFGIDFAITRY